MMITSEKSRDGNQKQPMKYWLVDITLTSGEELHFYVSAKNRYFAYEKADSYAELMENPSLAKFYKGKGFTLFP